MDETEDVQSRTKEVYMNVLICWHNVNLPTQVTLVLWLVIVAIPWEDVATKPSA